MQVSSDNSEKDSCVGEALLSLAQNRRIEPGLIARMIHASEPFREICADYEECCGKLQSLLQKNPAAGRQHRDYVEMRDELERELLRYLENADPQRGRATRFEQAKNE